MHIVDLRTHLNDLLSRFAIAHTALAALYSLAANDKISNRAGVSAKGESWVIAEQELVDHNLNGNSSGFCILVDLTPSIITILSVTSRSLLVFQNRAIAAHNPERPKEALEAQGTVSYRTCLGYLREDYSTHDAWEYFLHDYARSRTYCWTEDGLAPQSKGTTKGWASR